ncbi:MAG: methionyl-tRNA formyltransferase [Vicinamibacteria bacterium]
MRIVFLGSGAFAIPSLEATADAGHEVAALVTQPDREKGRGRALAPPPLKPVAEARGIPVLQPRRVRDEASVEMLRALAPEVQIVVAYGQILPRAVIDLAPRGTINVHASLLPLYRGAAPIQWAIVRGEAETGVTTMLIDEGLDTGPTLLSRSTSIDPSETAADLEPRLARLGAQVLLETLRGIEKGELNPVPQDASRATLAPIIRKEDGRVDWTMSATQISRRVRGFHPWPGTTTSSGGRALKIVAATLESDGEPAVAGTIVELRREGILVACGEGSRLLLTAVQPESRRPMAAAAFAAGTRLAPGARFD